MSSPERDVCMIYKSDPCQIHPFCVVFHAFLYSIMPYSKFFTRKSLPFFSFGVQISEFNITKYKKHFLQSQSKHHMASKLL